MNLALVRSEQFNGVTCDFYRDNNDIWITREQIGQALEYSNPQKAVDNLHERNKERLDQFSVTLKLRATDGKQYNTRVYSAKGVYEICRWSRQPKADAFMDFVWNTLEAIRIGRFQTESLNSEQFQRIISVMERQQKFIDRLLGIVERQPQQPQIVLPQPVNSKIGKLPQQLRDQVHQQIVNGIHYKEITKWLNTQGIDISPVTVWNYCNDYRMRFQIQSLRH